MVFQDGRMVNVYNHVSPDMQKAATDKLENLPFKPTGTLGTQ
jgi:hypothetical protein